MAGQRELFRLFCEVDSRGGLPDLLHGGKQEADQDRDDRDRHQEFNQREGVTTSAHGEAPNGRGGRENICPRVIRFDRLDGILG